MYEAVRGTGVAQVVRQVSQHGIKVGFWGSVTLNIVTPVENHPRHRLSDVHPLGGGGVNQRIVLAPDE